MSQELNMPQSLFKEIKENIIYRSENQQKSSISSFIKELPINLQSHLQLEIHKDLFEKCELFTENSYSESFYAWIGANLQHESASAGSVIYS